MAQSKATQFDLLLKRFDLLIKEGESNRVRIELKQIQRKQIPRSHLADVANIARRVQMPYFILTLLTPFIRPEKLNIQIASDREKAMYAAALSRIGSFKEADEIFRSLDYHLDANFYLYRALSYMEQWEYGKSIHPLRTYLKSEGLSEYSRMLGYINLAATLSSEGLGYEAEEILIARIESFSKNPLMHGNVMELLGQIYFNRKDFENAKVWLNRSSKAFQGMSSHFGIFARKWLHLMRIEESGNANEEFRNLAVFREEAKKNRYYEIVRDCDFYEALYRRDDELFLKVFFGTRFKHHRQKMLRHYQFRQALPTQYDWRPFDSAPEADKVVEELNLTTGIIKSSSGRVSSGHAQKLLRYLCTDFYRPFHLGEVSSHIYENEYFNPQTTPVKLHQLIGRLRKNLTMIKAPLLIQVSKNQLSIKAYAPVGVKISRIATRKIMAELELNILIDRFGKSIFSSHEVAQALALSMGTTRKILRNLLSHRAIKMTKRGAHSRYKLVGIS